MATRNDLIRPAASTIEQRRRQRNATSTIFQFPEDLGAHAIILNFKKYTFNRNDVTNNQINLSRLSNAALGASSARRQSSIETRDLQGNLIVSENYQGSVILPLPTSLQDSYNVQISSEDLGSFGSIVAQAASQAGSGENLLEVLGAAGIEAGRSASNFTLDAIRSALGMGGSTTSADTIAAARVFLQRQLESRVPGITTGIDVGLGNAVNPHVTLSFKGMQLKTHSFDWKFSPKNVNESERIKVISNYIRFNCLPKYKPFSNASITTNPTLAPYVNRPFLEYPSVVDIFFVGIDPQYFYFFKRCMVNNVSLNYTPEGLAIMKTGKPAFVSLNMQLTEQEIHTAEDYENIDEIPDNFGQVLG